MSSEPARLTFLQPHFGVAQWRNVHLVLLAGRQDTSGLAPSLASFRELARRHPRRVITLAVVLAEVPPADASVRHEAAESLRTCGDDLLRTIVVIDGDGVIATLSKAMARGINVILRRTHGVEVVGSVREACARLAADLVPPARPAAVEAELRAAVEQLRRAVLGRMAEPSVDLHRLP